MAKEVYKITPGELQILREGQNHPSLITDYFFRASGAKQGFIFDYNFTKDGAWQEDVCLAAQTDICVIGGFGSGKTLGVGMGGFTWCVTTPWFKFLNVAPRAWQAKQMYETMLVWLDGTPAEKLVWKKPKRPYPTIVFRFQIEDTVIESSMEFMSADRDATGILSWEGDWINIEEAGLIDNLDEVITSVGSRLRGSVRGRSRLGRLSMISNSWHNPTLWEYFDMAEEDPVNHLSIVVSTRDNKNVTESQLKRFLARIPESEHKQFIDGLRPEGKGDYFSKEAVWACENELMAERLEDGVAAGKPGYLMREDRSTGIFHFETPAQPGRMYMVFGDPGIDAAPKRNAPVLMVLDVTDVPREPAQVVALWWGDGGGKISPFVDMLLGYVERYPSVFAGIDSTASQKNTAEMINLQTFGEQIMGSDEDAEKLMEKLSVRQISGMDFSGSRKAGYLVALRALLESKLINWPKNVIGFRQQLTNYSLDKDKRIAQDLVATLAMAAWAIRIYFNVSISDTYDQGASGIDPDFDANGYRLDSREQRNTSRNRTKRSLNRARA